MARDLRARYGDEQYVWDVIKFWEVMLQRCLGMIAYQDVKFDSDNMYVERRKHYNTDREFFREYDSPDDVERLQSDILRELVYCFINRNIFPRFKETYKEVSFSPVKNGNNYIFSMDGINIFLDLSCVEHDFIDQIVIWITDGEKRTISLKADSTQCVLMENDIAVSNNALSAPPMCTNKLGVIFNMIPKRILIEAIFLNNEINLSEDVQDVLGHSDRGELREFLLELFNCGINLEDFVNSLIKDKNLDEENAFNVASRLCFVREVLDLDKTCQISQVSS